MIEPVFPQLDHFFCKFFLRAAAQRGFLTVTPQEFIKKFEDLRPHGKVERIIIEAGAEGFEHISGERELRQAVACEPF